MALNYATHKIRTEDYTSPGQELSFFKKLKA